MNLEGQAAIVTGGSLGIGSAIAISLAKEGANVAINYRKHDKEAKEIVTKIEGMGRKGLAVKADVSLLADAENMVQAVIKEFGKLDILVCNAGINKDAVIWKMTEDQWDNEQKHGKIVNITSINGLRGKFGQSNYSASKGGIIALTKTLARELGRSNVNVNAVAPGMIGTDMMLNLPEEWKQKAVAETVLGRIGTPEDVGNLVAFLCSDKANHITGEVIKIDGGQYI
jgi:3-oxoacyl-[acyl-carrier protein] reductase